MSERTISRLATSFSPLRSATRPLLAAGLLAAVLMLVAGCGSSAFIQSPGSPKASAPTQSGQRPPISPAVLRGDVERQKEWTPLRKAACPRQLPDRHEELRRYPAISILEGLGYIKITDGTAYGMYVKNMTITDAGRRELGSDLEESAERYVITIARREYLPGTEKFEILSGPNRLVARFQWRWKPLNPLGERLSLGPTSGPRSEYGGFATYTHSGGVWTLDKVYLNSEDKDYLRGV